MGLLRHITTITLLSLTLSQQAAGEGSGDDFAALVDQFNASQAQMQQEYDTSVAQMEAEYDALQAKIEAEHAAFTKEICKEWGEKSAMESDQHRWVEYAQDKRSRSMVDFESGEVEIELLLSDEELSDKSLVDAKVEQAVSKLLSSKGTTVDYDSRYIAKEELSRTPIMDDILDIRANDITREVTSYKSLPTTVKRSKSVEQLEREVALLRQEVEPITTPKKEPEAKQEVVVKEPEVKQEVVVKEPEVTVKRVETSEGERNVVTIKSALKVGYLSDVAKRFETMVMDNAERFNISPSLIYAIIETESSFSPTAESAIPAYGMMQIVPRSAGIDSYERLYGEQKLLSKEYLFQADKNIEIGTCYLNILATREFRGVTSPECKELCMIAAYNTGAGNVSRAFVGHTNVYKSIDKINALDYDELYNFLHTKLKIKEARDYVQKVTTKRVKYVAK